jgi:calcineurin-like phosphoesterase family protein
MAIYVTSDQHFSHIQPFVWQARGYESVEHMNEEQIRKWNEVVNKTDEVWFLGDGMMNDNEVGAKCFQQLNGKIHVITGNHDSPNRIKIYQNLKYDVQDAKRLTYNKKNIIFSHEPMITDNGAFKGWHGVLNIHGHTHQTTNFTEGYLLRYHAGVDSHDGYPILLDDILKEVYEYWKELDLA